MSVGLMFFQSSVRLLTCVEYTRLDSKGSYVAQTVGASSCGVVVAMEIPTYWPGVILIGHLPETSYDQIIRFI